MLMKKGEVVDIGKQLSKEYFRLYVETINGDFGILEDDSTIAGFREEDGKYVCLYILPKLGDVYCEVTYDFATRRLHSEIFKRINL